MRFLFSLALGACLLLSGCYQAKMTTGKPASSTVVQESFAPSFIGGLVPATIDVTDECRNGIASAERNLSFVNMLVGTLTLGIYYPQNVTVTCAAGPGMSDASSQSTPDVTLSRTATQADVQAALETVVPSANGTLHIHVIE